MRLIGLSEDLAKAELLKTSKGTVSNRNLRLPFGTVPFEIGDGENFKLFKISPSPILNF